ncbi:MAG: secondary thiamine-phosphate synthase enzyme YjbQ [Desulfurellaceae bacterium]|nr:secondary thiamine-phosphate synthase enzyme YjbQ [Desulfurellaceae bacterium]
MELKVRTRNKNDVVDLTRQIAELVRQADLEHGLCHVYVPHATAAIIVNENDDPQIGQDLLTVLDGLIPEGVWLHDKVDENGASHLKATILGPSETVPIQRGRLALGTWQAIMLVDFDGPRDRTAIVTLTRA